MSELPKEFEHHTDVRNQVCWIEDHEDAAISICVENCPVCRAERAERERDAWRNAVAIVRGHYPEGVFIPGGKSVDAQSADWARKVCDLIAEEAARSESS